MGQSPSIARSPNTAGQKIKEIDYNYRENYSLATAEYSILNHIFIYKYILTNYVNLKKKKKKKNTLIKVM
jgi:hypothetical protein